MQQESEARSLERLRAALAQGHKRAALASEVGISDGQLSKLLAGDMRRFCQIAAALGLEIFPTEYVQSLEHILKERL